jgi:nucleotide-binding universal stress UspA family protein
MIRVLKRILVAFDGSEHAIHAVKYVAQICSPSTHHVRLMQILPAAPEEVFWQVNMDQDFKRRMQKKYDRFREDGKREAMGLLERGKAILLASGFKEDSIELVVQEWREGIARDIIAESQHGYAAVVVARRGLGKMESLLLGSVSNQIVERVSHVPVWVIGGSIGSKKILLAVDGSENSRKAATYAAGFAGGSGAEVALLHVVRRPGPKFDPSLSQVYVEIEEDLTQRLRDEIQKMFDSHRACLETANVALERIRTRCRVASISRAGEILAEAREGGYGTIIMGRRGISKVRELVMGRVTSKVLNGAENLALWIVP